MVIQHHLTQMQLIYSECMNACRAHLDAAWSPLLYLHCSYVSSVTECDIRFVNPAVQLKVEQVHDLLNFKLFYNALGRFEFTWKMLPDLFTLG